MDVDVDDRHTPEAARDRMRGGHGDVVVETKTHGAIALRVVPRRTHERKRGLASQPFDVTDFILFESRLSRHGAHYEEVARYPLG